mmetsp:Transcript_22954/g.55685  ORF Transcript_22954/g.55685 Transcript_22954/m.55685 type:complete len:793 (+) Transcript_22954:77-2455(+)
MEPKPHPDPEEAKGQGQGPPAPNSKERRGSDGKCRHFDLVYLASCPLIVKEMNGVIPVEPLDLRTEQKAFMDTIERSQKRFRFKRDFATVRRLSTNLMLGCRALHYTGHGLHNGLAFEDECGAMHIVPTETLRDMISAGAKGGEGVKLVFVAACHSESAGRAFVEAGVRHVIAVKLTEKVADKGAQHFMRTFYLALLMGRTVKDAFEIARTNLQAAPNLPSSKMEARKYMLLPTKADHGVSIFPRLPAGRMEDCTDRLALENLPSSVDHFTGRSYDVQQIVECFVRERKRLVTLRGEAGIGKTAVAIDTARYLLDRGGFRDGVFFFRFEGCGDLDTEEIAERIAEGMNLSIPTHNIAKQMKRSLHRKEALLVLDGLDEIVSQQGKRLKQFHNFIRDLLDCREIRILATSGTQIGITRGVEELIYDVKEMRDPDICKLFCRLTGGRLTPDKLGLQAEPSFYSQMEIIMALQKHAVIKDVVKGHPGRCWKAAELFREELDLKRVVDAMQKVRRVAEYSVPRSRTLKRVSSGFTVCPSPSRDRPKSDGEVKNDPRPYEPVQPDCFPPGTDYDKRTEGMTGHERAFWDEFKPRTYVAFEEFKARLSKHFCHFAKVQRPLSKEDLHTMCVSVQRAANRSMPIDHRGLSVEAFRLWWGRWYIPLIKTVVRIRAIWDKGYIKGVSYSKTKARNDIIGGPVGTFLLRLSGNNAGCVAMAFVARDHPHKEVAHILIQVGKGNGGYFTVKFDTGQERAYETLEQLVLECKRVTILHPYKAKSGAFGSSEGENLQEDEEEGPS